MEAKLLQAIEISSNEILTIGSELKVLNRSCGPGGLYCLCELPNHRRIYIDAKKLEITGSEAYIDWEQFRLETAREIFIRQITEYPRSPAQGSAMEALEYADIFIEELKKRMTK